MSLVSRHADLGAAGADADSRVRMMALLDNAMADAALARMAGVREVVPVDMHISFVRPATGTLQASAHATGGGRSVCFCEATVTDANGAVVACAMGTLRKRDQ